MSELDVRSSTQPRALAEAPGWNHRRAPYLVAAGHAETGLCPDIPRLVRIDGVIEIGRLSDSPSSGFCPVPGSEVSRRHARIERSAESGWDLVDLDSTNGTFAGGTRVTGRRRLQDGAVIAIGSSILVFRLLSGRQLAAIEEDLDTPFGPVSTASAEVALVRQRLHSLARSELDILITGETGVGKEVYGRALHRASGRPGPFVPINCAAIPDSLVESELFGYARGAHSTASEPKPGLLQIAERGTLFLDEIGDMPLTVQTKLLRFLQDRRVTPLGATCAQKVDVRVVGATHQAISDGRTETGLRFDLVARLGPEPIHLPSLRSRMEDVGSLVAHFLRHSPRRFEPEAFHALFLHTWRGNIRELEKVVGLAAVLSAESGTVGLEHLPRDIAACLRRAHHPGEASGPGRGRRQTPSRAELEDLLQRSGGDVAQVARELGRQRTLVWRWLRERSCDPAQFRRSEISR